MRIPNRILEHPVEAAIASLLLLGLLFGSADLPSGKTQQATTVAAQKL